MLRQDALDIFLLMHKVGLEVSISTNGFRHRELVDFIKNEYPNKVKNFALQTSIDGPEEIHNRLRGTPVAFQNATALIDEAVSKGIPVTAVMTLSRANIDYLDDVFRLISNYKIPLLINFVRSAGDALTEDRSDFLPVEKNNLSIDEITSAIQKWAVFARQYMTYSNFLSNKARMSTILEFLRHKKWPYPCAAGYSEVVVFSNGDISLCESRKPIGNISDTGYDWEKFWAGRAQELKTCYCQWDCAMLSSLSKSYNGWCYLLCQTMR